jgi:hypothetical protein
MPAFADLLQEPPRKKSYLRTREEWSEVEKKCEANHSKFLVELKKYQQSCVPAKKGEIPAGANIPPVLSEIAGHVGLAREAKEDRSLERKECPLSAKESTDVFDDFLETSKLKVESVQKATLPESPKDSKQKHDASTFDPMEGFSIDEFNREILPIVSTSLQALMSRDYEAMRKEATEHTVPFLIRGAEVNVNILNDKIAEVQRAKDVLFSFIEKLTPDINWLEHSLSLIMELGLIHSGASNKEKRSAQVKYVMKDAYIQLFVAQRAYDAIKISLDRMDSQHSALRGLVSCLQERNAEISRGCYPRAYAESSGMADGSISIGAEVKRLVEESKQIEAAPKNDLPFDVDKKDVSHLDDFNPKAGRKRNTEPGFSDF